MQTMNMIGCFPQITTIKKKLMHISIKTDFVLTKSFFDQYGYSIGHQPERISWKQIMNRDGSL
jgi:hypothetical protein